MKVDATYRHVFEATRTVEIDDEDFAAWRTHQAESGHVYSDDEEAICAFLDDADTEFTAEVFSDWKISEPLPHDFELQWSEVVRADL